MSLLWACLSIFLHESYAHISINICSTCIFGDIHVAMKSKCSEISIYYHVNKPKSILECIHSVPRFGKNNLAHQTGQQQRCAYYIVLIPIPVKLTRKSPIQYFRGGFLRTNNFRGTNKIATSGHSLFATATYFEYVAIKSHHRAKETPNGFPHLWFVATQNNAFY